MSDAARRCPRCGYRRAPRLSIAERLFAIMILVIIVSVAIAVWYVEGPPAEHRRQRQVEACAAVYSDISNCLVSRYGWDEADAAHASLIEYDAHR